MGRVLTAGNVGSVSGWRDSGDMRGAERDLFGITEEKHHPEGVLVLCLMTGSFLQHSIYVCFVSGLVLMFQDKESHVGHMFCLLRACITEEEEGASVRLTMPRNSFSPVDADQRSLLFL